MENEKEVYERPEVTIVEFELKDYIAYSGDTGSDAICSEGLFG